jgi:hypothetical protein
VINVKQPEIDKGHKVQSTRGVDNTGNGTGGCGVWFENEIILPDDPSIFMKPNPERESKCIS